MPLEYVGRDIDAPNSVAYRSYLTAEAQKVLGSADVDARIASTTAPYATAAYAAEQDALYATHAEVDAGDSGKLKLTQKGVANGAVPLDATGKIAASHLAQLPLRAYGALYGFDWSSKAARGNVTSTGSVRTLARLSISTSSSTSIPRLGPWTILVFGYWEAKVNTSTTPYIEVRQSSASGSLVATGVGSNRTDYHPINILPDNPPVFAQVTTSTTLNFYAYGRIKSSGSAEFSDFIPALAAILIPC